MIPYLSADEVFARLRPADAVAAVLSALRDGLDPAAGVPRSAVPLAHGDLLLMPAESARHAGVKLATVAPDNPSRGLPRIAALYALFDAETLQPKAVIDGTALTTLRTPAVSVAAVHPFLPGAPRVVVFGGGPQAAGHVATLADVVEPASVTVVTRGGVAHAFPPGTISLRAGSPEVGDALRAADVVVCATTARTPLFDSALLPDSAIVVAVGSHEPDAREVDAALCARATVIVEDRATALRECGDLVMAIAEGALTPERLLPMADVVRGAVPVPSGRPVLFKGSGMSWQDLVVAEALLTH
ncbi:ornithine cyclodeaminase family protein [Catenuloplanes japonicus]|uniref:ornithine cyclodeaminase family protein n=1 Tax=Catenuloplanes japonicus TaxID=33876 RepID=UPI000526B29E|nr:ornithine cyclodeaminase family protein [Catenuloplanes japonicus]